MSNAKTKNMEHWIDIKEQTPYYGQEVLFKCNGDRDEEATTGTYEEHTCCMLGPRAGSMGEGFQDDLNKLACDGDLWKPLD